MKSGHFMRSRFRHFVYPKVCLVLSVFGSVQKYVAVFFVSLISCWIYADDVQLRTISDQLNDPWSIAFLPNQILVTEKSGQLRIIENGQLSPRAVSGVPQVVYENQAGLFDIAVHPNFSKNNWIYLSYVNREGENVGIEVVRAKLKGAVLSEHHLIFQQKPKLPSRGIHFGGRLAFDKGGFLFISVGENGRQEQAQNLETHLGKIIRLYDDGRIPEDNPFIGKTNALPEIWSYGHRNEQGLMVHPLTQELWEHEHGPQGGDEVNLIQAGRNYGWPVITYGVNYITGTKIGEGAEKNGMEKPLHKWIPSIAPSGIAFYEHNHHPTLRGSILVGSLKFQRVVQLRFDNKHELQEEKVLFDNLGGRVRDIRVSSDGFIYLLVGNRLLRY